RRLFDLRFSRFFDPYVVASMALALPACGQSSYPLPSTSGPHRPPPVVALDQPASRDHFYVQGAKLFDRCGEEVVLRGVNKMSVWTDRQGNDFSEIAKTGANSVRIVWTV